jgi:ABC-type multidrug transport system fused ATPase/permease subunit
MYDSERQLARLRLAFLRAVLSQEIGAFDTDLTSGKIISGISNDMSIIQDAIGEKVYMQLIYAQTFHALHLGIPHKSHDIMLTKFLAHSWVIFCHALQLSFLEY